MRNQQILCFATQNSSFFETCRNFSRKNFFLQEKVEDFYRPSIKMHKFVGKLGKMRIFRIFLEFFSEESVLGLPRLGKSGFWGFWGVQGVPGAPRGAPGALGGSQGPPGGVPGPLGGPLLRPVHYVLGKPKACKMGKKAPFWAFWLIPVHNA